MVFDLICLLLPESPPFRIASGSLPFDSGHSGKPVFIHKVNKARHSCRTQFEFPLVYVFKSVRFGMVVVEITL
jgi:hypothetical protein